MSNPTTLQSSLIPLAVSTDGTTYKIIVCKKTANFNGTTTTTKEETDCGSFKGLGANDWTMDFDGTVNTTPNGTETSWKDILNYWQAQTLLYVKIQSPSPGGTDFYIQGQAYLSNVKLTVQIGNLVAFSATFEGQGAIDNTP